MEIAIEGWDVHQESCATVRMSAEGSVLASRTVPTRREELTREAERLAREGTVVTMEASSAASYVRRILAEGGARVVVGHPMAIARFRDPKVKDDWVDAKLLAELYRLHAFPSIHDPSEWARRAREVCRYRHTLGEEITEVKNRVRALLLRHGLAEEFRHPFSAGGLATLARRVKQGKLPREVTVVVSAELAALVQFQELAARVEGEVARVGEERSDEVERLLSIRGCHVQLATTILAEIDGIERFPTAGQLTKYAGLTPGRNESAGVTRERGITKAGSPTLRWALTMLAESARKWEPRVRELYQRHKERGKKPKEATTAVARKMGVWIWNMLQRKEAFRHEEGEREEAEAKWSEKIRARRQRVGRAEQKTTTARELAGVSHVLEGLADENDRPEGAKAG
ncbi:MAG: IS110 family transposase [Thermoplasmata archaeon]